MRNAMLALLLAFVLPCQASAEPSCFASPPALSAAAGDPAAEPACQALAKVVADTAPSDIAWIPGAGVNALLGLKEGGFPTDAYVLRFRVSSAFNASFTGRDELVRFAIDEGRARGGSWWTPFEFVSDSTGHLLSIAQIESTLALPPESVPSVVAYSVMVQLDTIGYVGLVAPAFGRKGGGLQFWFPSVPVITTRVTPVTAPR